MSLRSRRRRKLKRLAWRRRLQRRRHPSFVVGGAGIVWGQAIYVSATGSSTGLCYRYEPATNPTSFAVYGGSGTTVGNETGGVFVSSGLYAQTYRLNPVSFALVPSTPEIQEHFPADGEIPATSISVPANASDALKAELREEHVRWRAGYVQRLRESQENFRAQVERHRIATERARGLLLRHMTAAQRESFEKDKKFEVVAPSGNRYILNDFLSANIEVLDEEGVITHRLCIHIEESGVPKEDSILVQKIMLENGLEDELIRLANKHPVRSASGGLTITGGGVSAASLWPADLLTRNDQLTFVNPVTVNV